MKRNEVYFLMRDILGCFPDRVGIHLIYTLNSHKVAKDFILKIFKDEIKKEKPEYRILMGAISVLNSQLFNWYRNFYDSADTIAELKYCCFQDKRKTVKGKAMECILRLFLSLYHENKIVKSLNSNDKRIVKFKNVIKSDDMKKITETLGIFIYGNLLGRLIFEKQMFKFDTTNPTKEEKRFNYMLNEFYS